MSQQWVTTKFGGTSVSNQSNWQNIASIIKRHRAKNRKVFVVCSAPSEVSNRLDDLIQKALVDQHAQALAEIENIYRRLASELSLSFDAILKVHFDDLKKKITGISLLKEISPRVKAQIMAFGELLLTMLGAEFLKAQSIQAKWLDAREWLLVDKPRYVNQHSSYLSAKCDPAIDDRLLEELSSQNIAITQGFIASNDQGETVLLGRGGSDTSAAYFSVKINAARCEIWTDVPGIYTANPKLIPEARLLTQLDYDEAQEIASMGGKVLHPQCVSPLKNNNIPLYVKFTADIDRAGTVISREQASSDTYIKSILSRQNILLISIETMSMWQQAGFLAQAFDCFKNHGVSIDLISTSESSITVSLDNLTQVNDSATIAALLDDLNKFARAKTIGPCASISLVGQNIRRIIHQLGGIFSLFESQQIHMLSQAANDLNLTFVVDQDQCERLIKKLHNLLIEQSTSSCYFNQSWLEEFGEKQQRQIPWWERKREALLENISKNSPCYVYDDETIDESLRKLKQLTAIQRIFYAMKANPHESVLRQVEAAGFGIECVSIGEVRRVFKLFPSMDPKRVLFTPNFAPKSEYEFAFKKGIFVTIDSLYPLEHWLDLLSGQSVILRIDPGYGAGHHKFVTTGGSDSKFGVGANELDKVCQLAEKHKVSIQGLHIHSGSGILEPHLWRDSLLFLSSIVNRFPDCRIINLGGGLGIVEKPGQSPLDLATLNKNILDAKNTLPGVELWLEPGRYVIAHAGIILARVTQIKQKGDIRFVGIETGMNSLIRPALYGSFHEIVNLSRLHEPKSQVANIVGPICESADVLGYARTLPETQEGDVMLIANTGAYGYCMSSHYNLRDPAAEVAISENQVVENS